MSPVPITSPTCILPSPTHSLPCPTMHDCFDYFITNYASILLVHSVCDICESHLTLELVGERLYVKSNKGNFVGGKLTKFTLKNGF